jgi:uncharacterized protein YjeT (DUF2065 family)
MVLVVEGVLYALFPDGMKRLMAQMMSISPTALRVAGLVAVGVGVAGVYLARRSLAWP